MTAAATGRGEWTGLRMRQANWLQFLSFAARRRFGGQCKNVNKSEAGRMEQTEAETQKKTVDNVNPAEKQTGKATGETSSQMSEPGAICEPEARWSRLKLFDKVMQKSLDKFIGQAR